MLTLPRVPGTRAATPLAWVAFGGALALLVAFAYANLGAALTRVGGQDMDAYWNAALRLRAGEPLYAAGAANAHDLYRYAPWFAVLWIPLTYLPQEVVRLAWSAVLLAAAVASLWPLRRAGGLGAVTAGFFFVLALEGLAYGNVQALLVAALVLGCRTRYGPLLIAAAASLKAVPIILVVVDLRQRRYRRAALTLALTAVLVLPMLAFDLSAYSLATGSAQVSLAEQAPALWAAVALAAVGVTFWLGRGRFAWLAAGTAMILSLPRLLPYEFSFLQVGLAQEPPTTD